MWIKYEAQVTYFFKLQNILSKNFFPIDSSDFLCNKNQMRFCFVISSINKILSQVLTRNKKCLFCAVFVYSMPGYSVPIKERMVYSSSKNPITDYLQNSLSLNIAKKVCIYSVQVCQVFSSNAGDNLNQKYLKWDRPYIGLSSTLLVSLSNLLYIVEYYLNMNFYYTNL